MVQTDSPSKKERVERAIEHALERHWDLAAEVNRALLDDDPQDVEAANRLGKALTELNDLAGAADAYQHALSIDAANAIARKNLARLGDRRGGGRPKRARRATKKASATRPAALAVHSLVEESGKSAEFALRRPNRQALKGVVAGDAAALEPVDQGVVVKSVTGAMLGTIDARPGLRLMRMMEGGNGYAAVIRHVDGGEATVYIREVHTDPSLVGQASFIAPPSAGKRSSRPRAYTKASVVQYDAVDEDDPDEDTHDEQDGRSPRRAGPKAEQSDEMEDRGFSEDRAAATDDDDDGDEDADEALDDSDDEELAEESA